MLNRVTPPGPRRRERAPSKSAADSRWRAWETSRATAPPASVTSTRLPTGAGVKNRLFPKTRSWFALGAPLELMSPLSVIRVVLAFEALVCLGACLFLRHPSAIGALAAGLAPLALWLVLLEVRALSERESAVLLAASVADVAVLLWSGPSSVTTFAYVAVTVPIAASAALFLRGRLVLALLGIGALGIVVPAARTDIGQAVGSALLWTSGAGAAAAAVFLLVRTVQRQGRTDADTGLPNGFGLAQLVRQRQDWSSYVVASMSLDGIGNARRALGYRTGSELVRRAVEDLGQVLPGDALIGRVVADELVIVQRLADLPSEPSSGDGGVPTGAAQEAQSAAARLVRAIRSGRYLADGVEVALRAHIGLAVAPWDGTEVEELIRKASLSAPAALNNGTGTALWNGNTGALTAEDLALLAELRLAGERGELALAYQPQISLRQAKAVAVEALLRWKNPARGMVPPDRFIVLAERTGLIDRLTDWVVGEALDAQVRWRAAGIEIPVSVNVSAASLARPDLPDWVLHELMVRHLPQTALALEITETAAPEDLARAVDLLRPLHDQGVRISIDDFGVGYTSLSVLPRLALDEIKMDQGFVRRALSSPIDEAIVRSVCELAHRLGIDAVAEGVENEEMCRLVADAGYDLVQGFYFARPMAERDVLEFLVRDLGPDGLLQEAQAGQTRQAGDVGVDPAHRPQPAIVPH